MGPGSHSVIEAHLQGGPRVFVLIDSGCRPYSFISESLVESLDERIFPTLKWELVGVYGDGRSWRSTSYIDTNLRLDGTLYGGGQISVNGIRLHVLPDLCVDVVVGSGDIVKYNLFRILERQLRASVEQSTAAVAMALSDSEDLESGVGSLEEAYPPLNEQREDTMKILSDAIRGNITSEQGEEQQLLIKKFIACFSNELDRRSKCKIPPMELIRLKEGWDPADMRAMKLKVRRQCPEHHAEIDRQVDKLLERNFIEECNTEYYSQILLARKQDQTWRLCTDFRHLNKLGRCQILSRGYRKLQGACTMLA